MFSAATCVTALIAFTVFLITGAWEIHLFYQNTPAVPAFDLFLSVAFFARHSGMIRNSFKAWFARFAPEYYHGAISSIVSGFCHAAGLVHRTGVALLQMRG